MATIRWARGARDACPALTLGEAYYATDTREMFIGNGVGNVPLLPCQWHGCVRITNAEGQYQFRFVEHGLPPCESYAVQLTTDAPYPVAALNRTSAGFLVQVYDLSGQPRNPLWDDVVKCGLGVFCGQGVYCGQVPPLLVDIHAYLNIATEEMIP